MTNRGFGEFTSNFPIPSASHFAKIAGSSDLSQDLESPRGFGNSLRCLSPFFSRVFGSVAGSASEVLWTKLS